MGENFHVVRLGKDILGRTFIQKLWIIKEKQSMDY